MKDSTGVWKENREEIKMMARQFFQSLYVKEAEVRPQEILQLVQKRVKDGQSIIDRHWPKVAKTFDINEGSIFAFRFSSFPDEIHLSIYSL